jgi:hypothetical protein
MRRLPGGRSANSAPALCCRRSCASRDRGVNAEQCDTLNQNNLTSPTHKPAAVFAVVALATSVNAGTTAGGRRANACPVRSAALPNSRSRAVSSSLGDVPGDAPPATVLVARSPDRGNARCTVVAAVIGGDMSSSLLLRGARARWRALIVTGRRRALRDSARSSPEGVSASSLMRSCVFAGSAGDVLTTVARVANGERRTSTSLSPVLLGASCDANVVLQAGSGDVPCELLRGHSPELVRGGRNLTDVGGESAPLTFGETLELRGSFVRPTVCVRLNAAPMPLLRLLGLLVAAC